MSQYLGIWSKWFYFRVVQYSDLTGVYLYKLDDRWRVSPNYENKKSWFFTDKGVKTLTKDTKFYHGDDSSYKIHKSKFRVATLENVRDTCKLSHVGDNLWVLVTDVDDIFWMLVPMIKDSGCWWPKCPKLSPISYSCHRHISFPTSVANIDVTEIKLWFSLCIWGRQGSEIGSRPERKFPRSV